ncbi:MAG TPA: glycosyltransferase family 39 protein [Acidimicrobiia bacterium]|nr:glycosyltransferase family 39 protein [Acidimicrobiia bacterium]
MAEDTTAGDLGVRAFLVRVAPIALAGLAIRVVYVLVFRMHTKLSGDEVFYSYQANALADGKGFNSPFTGKPAADHPPLTAIVLTPASWIWHHSVLAQRLTMALVGTILVVVIGLLAREIAGNRAGLIAAALAAVYPGFVVADGVGMSEPIAAVFVAATLLFLYRLLRRDDGRPLVDAALAGVALGLAVLTRAELALLLVLAVVPVVWMCRGTVKRRLVLGSAAVVALLVVLAPWVAFNLARFEKPVYVSSNDGLTLVGANCPATYSGPTLGAWDLACANPQPDVADQSVADGIYRRRAYHYVRTHFDRLPVVVAARFGRAWSLFRPFQTARFAQEEGRPLRASELGVLAFYPLVAVAVVGAWVLHRRRVTLVPLLATVVAVTIVAVGFYGSIRDREPAEVAFVVLAAVAIDALLSRARERDVAPPHERRDHGERTGAGEAAQAEAGTSTVS